MDLSTRETLEKAISNNPGDIDARLHLAELIREERSPEEALEVYEGVLELDPDNPLAHLGKGLCWAMSLLANIPTAEIWDREIDEQEMIDNAMECLEQAAELDPELTEAYNAMGRLFAIIAQEEDAVDMFKQSLQVDSTQLDVLEDLQELTGKPVWKILDKGTWMGEEEE
ncbi:MAG: tetratricopeptide repeat protein [Candidatus Aegiribacteria sp.]|nr:tetratricopeptide repeat protein [Candidatus Aegiribacteria sp.]MBD3294416.1 tetratricopeptide repeat protein [Candidatus Fermentibacteria bacterium]